MNVEEKAGKIWKEVLQHLLKKNPQIQDLYILGSKAIIERGLREHREIDTFKVLDKVREGIREGQRMAFARLEALAAINTFLKIDFQKGTAFPWAIAGEKIGLLSRKTLQEAVEKAEASNGT